MFYLIIGLILWWGAHLLGRLQPNLRRDMNTALGKGPSRGLIALVLFAAVVLLVIGYRQAEFISIYSPYPGAGHLNNLLMLFAIFVFGIGPAGGRLSARVRHPMLLGVMIWSFAHLIVNGDIASLLLFGGIGVWSLVQMRLINQHEGPWEKPMPGNSLQDWKLALIALFLYVLITGIHWLFDHNPFLGTYP